MIERIIYEYKSQTAVNKEETLFTAVLMYEENMTEKIDAGILV